MERNACRLPLHEAERSEAEVERETGFVAPSTNQAVEFIYRLASLTSPG